MAICANCGEENPDRFRLCGFCGTPLAAPLPPREARKTVTIVFSDLKGSTSLGERLDSESLRELMTRYFDAMRAALERHGGRVEKYIGDAIMAVFGLPQAHEDDALRAVRAASDMKAALETINDELERRWGVALQNRTGVNTGEVVAGDSIDAQRLVTGDAVNVAARLEQAAPALEVLVGQSTYRLVRHAVDVEQVEPLELKGKAQRVEAFRLIGVRDRFETAHQEGQGALVGRAEELTLLEDGLARAGTEGRAQLVVLVGEAGLGKSRLVAELTERLRDRATTLRGRALSYGDGITFWPLVELVRQAAGITNRDQVDAARAKLERLTPERPDLQARIASAVGLSTESFPIQELFWATRELLELLAAERPLAVCFEDVHWAEPTFLDLVEQLVDGVRAPVLIVCDARPELLEERPGWRERPGSTLVRLEPLTRDESARVIENRLGEAGLDAAVRAQVVRAAEGNPLFVEQLLSMLIEDGRIALADGLWQVRGDLHTLTIPPSIQTLLAARLDRLDAEQRAVLDPASVIGYLFAQAAVGALVPEGLGGQVPACLAELEAKQLVAGAGWDGFDSTYRFQHVLIRDTAYEALLKRARATLHERFVAWAEERNRESGREAEFEEILGYHLEQAHRYLGELGPHDQHSVELGRRGAEKLASAGRRAFQRGDMPAAGNLLGRAAALLPAQDPRRHRLLPMLAEAVMEAGEFASAEALLDEALTAVGEDDVRLYADTVLTRLLVRHHVTDDLAAWRAQVLEQTERLIPALEQLEAHAELAKAWRMAQFVHGPVCQWGKQVATAQRALSYARLAGDRRLEARLASSYVMGLCEGPTPVVEAIAETRALIERGLPDRLAEAMVRCLLAYLLAMNAEFDAARDEYGRGGALLDDFGAGVMSSFATIAGARVELLARRPEDAATLLETTYDSLGRIGERYFRPLVGALLSHALLEVGSPARASDVVTEAEAQADPDDTEAQVILRSVRARLCAASDASDLAFELAREAVALTEPTDAPVMRANALATLAEVLAAAGPASDAESARAEARALYEQKGNLAAATRLPSALS